MLKTISEVLPLSAQFLNDHHIERARRSAEELLSSILGIKRLELYMQFDRPLIESEMEKMRVYLKRCIKGEPIAYILGEVEFLKCRIEVSSDVLIPRPETEILVDFALKQMTSDPHQKLWDLCTGSGCIGLSIKRARPDIEVSISDISPKALAIARINAANNKLDIDIREGDLLNPFNGEKADYVICNPPYVSQNEFAELDQSVRAFEPALALLGGERGTDFYERLSRELSQFLNPGAKVFLEIGTNQGRAIQEIFNHAPWKNLQLMKDWAGHDRFFFLEIE